MKDEKINQPANPKNIKYSIKQAEKLDAKRVWEIRNHPDIRKVSGSIEVIPLENHIKWFEKKYFSDDNTNYCFVLTNGKDEVVGYCRYDFDEEKDRYIVSISLDPNVQSKGLGGKLLSESLQILQDNVAVLAEVKKDNIPSIKLFEKNNFKKLEEDEENYYFIYKK